MKIKKKIIICILLAISLMVIISMTAYAAEGESGSTDSFLESAIDTFLKLTGSVVGIFTWPIKLIVMGIAVAIQGVLLTLGAVSGGGTGEDGGFLVTPSAILFNKLRITSIDFFDFGGDDYISGFRENIAMWYYALRFIAAVILLAILVYIGIRMVISTVADERAKYKKMIIDWITSLALLFMLHYIIVFVITANDALVSMLDQFVGDELDFTKLLAALLTASLSPLSGIGGFAAMILYCIFVFQTLKFFIMYVKRMITIGFLILISPLITITYSVDRAGDQKAQALNTWLKEFVYNILIQPFHCVLYLAFAQVAFTTLLGKYTRFCRRYVSYVSGVNHWLGCRYS